MEYAKDIIETRHVRKYKNRSEKCQRDHKMIFERVKLNGIKMDFVSAYIDRIIGTKVTYLNLLSFAIDISSVLEIKLDRLAKRNRNALLCWYAENWERIQPHIQKLKTMKEYNLKTQIDLSISNSPQNHQIDEKVDPTNLWQLLNHH
ncbi:hypothetical protein TVAG_126600 [Trichomonas vaginalis G3]|uniref:Uncharacterized protein n=1 Tax=Trichomonas vaginalis (strain ATCC PRA-98 / G3) TaxID=412133 RepID=A2FHS0_TRIV3|nr:hypothetical protein TVAGG3_0460590 [Trichomonas vaginalis G3]EAX95530.1 hypothetical protein TVAG_126600 [Trichomonas vaginalis G3]KAI5514385.1 hypothetical protein TVAGG3_0460590 [Trichomonas vaginalis G3]|eukprot:XP_001308460.1 hypothetical protein [Trichomonas vaginalis G3]